MSIFEQAIMVRWSDLDPNGHVRHSVCYDFGAQVRIAYLEQEGFGVDWMMGNGIGPVLFREEARFSRELHAGDALKIDVRLAGLSVDNRKWSMRHRIMRGTKLCATIDIDGAWLSRETRRIIRMPKDLAEKFSAMERTEDFRIITPEKRRGK